MRRWTCAFVVVTPRKCLHPFGGLIHMRLQLEVPIYEKNSKLLEPPRTPLTGKPVFVSSSCDDATISTIH